MVDELQRLVELSLTITELCNTFENELEVYEARDLNAHNTLLDIKKRLDKAFCSYAWRILFKTNA